MKSIQQDATELLHLIERRNHLKQYAREVEGYRSRRAHLSEDVNRIQHLLSIRTLLTDSGVGSVTLQKSTRSLRSDLEQLRNAFSAAPTAIVEYNYSQQIRQRLDP